LATYFPGQESNTLPGLLFLGRQSRRAGGSSAQPQRYAVPRAVIRALADR